MVSAETRCEVFDLPTYSCAHCTGRDGGETAARERRTRLLDLPGIVAARFAGQCAECGTWYQPGEPITHVDGYGWAASCCIEEARRG